MKKNCLVVFVLSVVVILVLSSELFAGTADKNEPNLSPNDLLKLRRRQMELPTDRVDHILNQLKETDPNRAKELSKLRTEDPQAFRTELGKVIRGNSIRKLGPRREPGALQSFAGQTEQNLSRRPSDSKLDELMSKKYDEHLDWLKKNYPQEAERLARLKDTRQDEYKKEIALSLRKYGRIAELSKNDPELSEVLKESLELKEQRDKLLEKIRTSSDEKEKKKLITELEGVIGRNFALIAKKKQLEHNQLVKKLEDMQQEVKKSESEVKKWNDTKFRNKQAKTELEDLTSGKGNAN